MVIGVEKSKIFTNRGFCNMVFDDIKYYNLLAENFPTKKDVVSEIINLKSILNLPKGTEHFISDIHGEDKHFLHILKTASGIISTKIADTYDGVLSKQEQTELANLIYYPDKILKGEVKDAQWYCDNLLRLIEICKIVCSKYSRSKVRKALPSKYAYIIDELLNCDSKNINKENYYNTIIENIIEMGSAEDFIIEIASVIRDLSIDHLHIIGDIFDRGPRPDNVIDTLMGGRSLDIQWGNHDIIWIGAMMGSEVCISVAVANSLKYKNLRFLEEGYGISLRPLEELAIENYDGESNTEKMYKAISIIRFKLEDQIMKNNDAFDMKQDTRLDKIDFDNKTWCGYGLNCDDFSTINRENPSELTAAERKVIEGLKRGFLHSEKIKKHLNFLLSKGSMYLCYNGNLLFHGCIPLDENGELLTVRFGENELSGKQYMDFCNNKIKEAYKKREEGAADFCWYLWCSPNSPLFGKDRITTFERMFVEDSNAHIEKKQYYFIFQENEEVCNKILTEFGLSTQTGHIINGHIPVKFKDGEQPIKANGKLILIDGGMSKTYRKQTGIAGYTLTFNSYGLAITSHYPYESVNDLIENNKEMLSVKYKIQTLENRILVKDTDGGKELLQKVRDLKKLITLYDSGLVLERVK